MQERHLIAITGGPGAGKTTLIAALADKGYATAPEAGRHIIQMQTAIDGIGHPASNPLLFAELMLAWDLRSHGAAGAGLTFFDRGVPDTIGYLRLIGEQVPEHMINAARVFRYRPKVFILPPWREIYSHDAERKHGYEEAVATFEAMAATYHDLGYDLVEVPRLPIDQRANWIVEHTGLG